MGFPGGSAVENPSANAEDEGSIPGLGRSPGEGNGNPLHYPCLERSCSPWGHKRVGHDLVTKQTTTTINSCCTLSA